MKKIYLTLLPLFLAVFCFSQKTEFKFVTIENNLDDVLISFDIPSYEIRDTSLLESYNVKGQFCYIHNDDFGVTNDIGYPYLPQYTMEINVPNNSYEYNISVLEPKYTAVSLKHDIIPVQEDFKDVDNKYTKSDYYESDGREQPYPIVISEPFVVMGEKGISVTIFPFLYNPKKNNLRVLTHAKFKISYSLTANKNDYSEPSDVKKRYLKKFFANYDTNILKSGSSFYGKYLIITDATFEEALSSFANYKRNIGYDVDVYTTTTTGNTVTSIKNFIQAKYDNTTTRPDFVLLVGDYSKIPASCGSISYDIDNPISDLNYARLEGSDYFADVFLGRFPIDSTTELQNIINKTIYMEMNLHSFDKEAVFIAGAEDNNWMQNQFENGHDYVVSETFTPEGYTCHKLYQPNLSSVVEAINENPLFVLYSGHGNETCLAGNTFTFCSSNLNNLSNTIYPFVFSFACKTGNFYKNDCLGENFITKINGAVTYFGSSVETMVNSDKAIEKKLFGDAFTDEEHISAIINLGMKRYWERFWSSLNENRTMRYMKAYNLLGDPSLNILGLGCRTLWNFQNPEVFCNNSDITYASTNYITNNNGFVVKPGANISLTAENYIRLKPGMEIKKGATFHAHINNNCCEENINKSYNENTFEINLAEYYNYAGEEDEQCQITMGPNPFKDMISIHFFLELDGSVEINIYDTNGLFIKQLMSNSLMKHGEHSYTFNLSDLKQGIYLLILKTSNGKFSSFKIEKL